MKTWFITGTSSGFGRSMTERLLTRGDRVVATLRKSGALDDLRELHGDRLRQELLDVTDRAAVRVIVDRAFGAMGRIDVVVNNAGYGLFGAAEELDDAEIDRQIATNLTGSIQVIRAALPHLRAQNVHGARGGRIVQVSSEGGQIAYPSFGMYHATKWGIEGFVEAVAQEVAAFGIDFLLVEPGPTGTDFKAGLAMAEPMAIYADTPAGAIRRGMADGSFAIRGDLGRSVEAMIAAIDQERPPLRLVLGSAAFRSVGAALAGRARALAAQEAVASSADAD